MNWLLPKLELQIKLASELDDNGSRKVDASPSTFKENLLLPEEESNLSNIYRYFSGNVTLCFSGRVGQVSAHAKDYVLCCRLRS